jgi:NDP-sugar pyrophosphorylase family protein
MLALLLAGGQGSRLAPYTDIIPKGLFPINDKPVSRIMAQKLLKHGLAVVLCINKPWEPLFRHEFRDMPVQFSVSEEPLGTAGEVKNAEKLIHQSFLVAYSDDLTDIDYTKLIAFHNEHKDAFATLALTHSLPLEVGICNVDNDRVVALREKPIIDLGAWTGTAIYEPNILQYCLPHQDFASDIVPKILKEKKVYAFYTDSVWFDIGSYGHYKRACEMMEGS